jgi:hypothetical protein
MMVNQQTGNVKMARRDSRGAGITAAPNRNCHFCGTPGCRIGSCLKVEEYRVAGKVIHNTNRRVTLPSGGYIPRTITGSTLAAKFDQYHLENPGQMAKVAGALQPVTMYETVETLIHEEARIEEYDDPDESIEDLARVFANEAARKFDKRKKGAEPSKKAAEKAPVKPFVPAIVDQPTTPSDPNPNRPPKPEPQYHFLSPCENAPLVTQVWNKAMDATITVTPRELLAISTDLRKRYREFTTSKRIAGPHKVVDNALYETLYAQMTDDGLIAVDDSAPLRSLYGELGGKLMVECVIDNGSSIIACSRPIWERLGAPLRFDMLMRMESSHGTIEKTIGVLKDYPLRIGGSTFFVQIQVSENLPCEVLLGRPFFMNTESATKDHRDGSQEVTLFNPNGGEEITVPTFVRTRKMKDF